MAKPDDVVIELDDTDMPALLAQAAAFEKMKKDAAAAFEKVANEIRDRLGEATVGTIGGIEVVTNRWQARSKTDTEKLQRDFPDAYAAVIGHTRYRKLDRNPKRAK